MVKAIQELEVKSEKLIVENIRLKNENRIMNQNNEKLSSEVETLKQMNAKIVKLEKMMNEMNSVKHTALNNEEVVLTNSKKGERKMKNIIFILASLLTFTSHAFSQSVMNYQAGTAIEVQTGADICADGRYERRLFRRRHYMRRCCFYLKSFRLYPGLF